MGKTWSYLDDEIELSRAASGLYPWCYIWTEWPKGTRAGVIGKVLEKNSKTIHQRAKKMGLKMRPRGGANNTTYGSPAAGFTFYCAKCNAAVGTFQTWQEARQASFQAHFHGCRNTAFREHIELRCKCGAVVSGLKKYELMKAGMRHKCEEESWQKSTGSNDELYQS